MNNNIEVASPISVGISAHSILRFIDRLEHYEVNMHSFLLMRHDKLIAEGYYAPYTDNTMHRMFSINKTLTALAVSLLIEENLFKIDDPIADYFQDMLPENAHPWITSMTIRNMLMMRTCHASTTYKHNPDMEWVKSFFVTPPTHKPGTVFHYDTSSPHVLGMLVERLTQMSVLNYLRLKAFDEMGWSKDSYVLENKFSQPQNGSGLMALPRDILSLGKLLMQEGKWNGKQLFPKKFIQEMTSNLTPTTLSNGIISETQGYGYQVWRSSHNGFVCYGMGGQLVLCLPDYDIILVTTADTQGTGGGNDLIYNCFYEEILPQITASTISQDQHSDDEDKWYQILKEKLDTLSLTPVKKRCPVINTAQRNMNHIINGKTFYFEKNEQGFDSMKLTFSEESGSFTYSLSGIICEIPFRFDSCEKHKFPIYDMSCATSAMWLAPDTFLIKVYIIDTSIGSVQFEFVFGEDDVTVFLKKIEETMFNEYTGHLYGS